MTMYCGDNCNHTGPHRYPPSGYTWGQMGWTRPESITREVPDMRRWSEVVLVDHRGQPLMVREPRAVGFREP